MPTMLHQPLGIISSLLRSIASQLDACITRPTWRGVYARFEDVPNQGQGYNQETLANQAIENLRKIMEMPDGPEAQSATLLAEQTLLPLLASSLSTPEKPLTILDFGGGAGIGFVQILRSLGPESRVAYHIVECPSLVQAGSRFWHSEPRIAFHNGLSDLPSRIDIVYLSSSLQYIQDYPSLLKSLCALKPKRILLAKLSTGDFPTYTTAQLNLGPTSVPYWFINTQDLITLLHQEGYTRIYQSLMERIYPQSQFSPQYRMNRTTNLLFAPKEATP